MQNAEQIYSVVSNTIDRKKRQIRKNQLARPLFTPRSAQERHLFERIKGDGNLFRCLPSAK